MRCDEAGECLSALYDGEEAPPHAAEHMARCAKCRELLKGYAETGAALRSYGSLLRAEPVPERIWLTTERNTTMWWEKGLQTMRIPRIAFACLVLLLVALGSRLALMEVRADEDGTVLMLKLTTAQGNSLACDVPAAGGAAHNDCGGLWQTDRSNLFYDVKALKRDGRRVLLSVRSKVTPVGPAGFGPDTAGSLPETQYWFTPGESLPLQDTGELKLTLTGAWGDHIPVGGHGSLDPGANEIRLASPLLLKNNVVVGDFNGSAGADKPGEGVSFYVPGEGRFIFSSTPMAGAVPATVQLNRVTFESNGRQYMIAAGMPVCRGDKLWVVHEPGYRPARDSDGGPIVAAGPVGKLL